MKVSEIAQPGKPRQILAFELRMNIIADATIDLLFTKNRVNNENLSRKCLLCLVYCDYTVLFVCAYFYLSQVFITELWF